MKTKILLPYNRIIQAVCPAPKRHLQNIILTKKFQTGLDIGCGDYSLLTPLRAYGFHSTGLDAWQGTVDACKIRNAHDEYLLGNFLEMEFSKKFDVIILSHVIEHMDRETGMKVLRKIEGLAKYLVYIETPNGFLEQLDMGGNPWQRHLSGWFPHDFESRGYSVYGSSPKFLLGSMGYSKVLPSLVSRAIARSVQFYYFRKPRAAHAFGAIRFTDDEGNIRVV